MERHNGIEFDPEGAFVYYDDAQRALDAEREKVKELEQKLQDMTESKVRCWNQWTFAEQEVKEQGDQLATLQAQADALKDDPYRQGFADALEKVAQDFQDKGFCSIDEIGVVEVQAFLDTRHVHYEECRGVKSTQAQLRQVEEALQERKEFIADCDTALDRIQAPRTNEGQEELVSTWRRIELLGKLLYQYRQELERSAPALRAENARFRAVLMNMQAAWNNKNEVTSVYVWNERMKAAMADVDAALQPERGQP